ncbi:right-handed parallel beta-helix repeat-containing protein [Frigoribacterium sp. R86507]|uniref:right-handed parallel beta-helix repeat-containing protein n=1 Tax=Frigoribacterium sp. R86507 TaxID=3093850 RepID=UPI0037C535E2
MSSATTPRLDPPTRSRAVAGALVTAVACLAAVLVPATSASSAPTTVASDAAGRTISGGWGPADAGGTWTTWSSPTAAFSVARGVSTISGLAPGASATATLKSVSVQDVEVREHIALPKTAASLYQGWELRRQADGSAYRGRLELAASGKAVLVVTKVWKGKETALGRADLPSTVTTGSTVAVAFRAVGTTTVSVQGKAWVRGSAEPAWQVSVSDSAADRVAAPGAVGIWQYASTGNKAPVETSFDDLVVTSSPQTAVPAPEPVPVPAPVPAPTTPAPVPAPTTPAPTTPAPVPAVSQGSLPVGGASYAVPAGAVVVSPSGNDSAAGTQAAPLRTLAAAIAKAPSGGTVVLRAGSYNEGVVVPFQKKLTIQSFPREAVWLDGSVPVSTWQRSGSGWSTPWSFFPSADIGGSVDNPRFVSPSFPYAARPDQVFLDGVQLTQVAPSQLAPGTFAPDPAGGRVLIGSDPAGHELRISNKQQAIWVQSPDSTVRGLGIRRYATPNADKGAIRFGNTGGTAENLVVQDNAMIGINLENNGGRLRHLTVERSGLLGVGTNASYDLELTDSVVRQNNWQRFKEAPVSGGVKITRSRGVTVTNNDISRNYSSGLWLDESVYDSKVTGNTVDGNEWTGIQLELSSKAVVADNVITGGKAGLQIMDTDDVRVYNNSIGGFSEFGIKVTQDERRQATAPTGQDRRRPIPDPTMTWVTGKITIANNAFGSGGRYQVFVLDSKTNRSADSMGITVSGNAFNQRRTAAQATLVGWGGGDNKTVTRFDTAVALSAKNSSWRNVETQQVLDLGGMTSLLTSSLGIVSALPSDIAALLGQPGTARRIGAF